MAARYPKITIRAAWSYVDNKRGNQTQQVRVRLGSTWYTYRRGGNSTEFIIPDPSDISPAPGRTFVLEGVANVLALVQKTIVQRGLPYKISTLRDAGDDNTHFDLNSGDVGGWPVVEFDIEGTTYDPIYDLDFASVDGTGFTILSNLTTIRPLVVRQDVTHAGIYGSATGAVTLTADGNGDPATFTYAWADNGVFGRTRTKLLAGTYYCTVIDHLNEQVRVTVVIKQDDKLEVEVNTTPNSAELVPRGGLGPYSYAWLDGPTTATRTGLVAGTTYECTVTDARGASRTVQVIIATGSRYWFSGNPIVLSLDAGQAYRDDPSTKPGLSFVCQVFVEPVYLSGNFVALGQVLEQPADVDGRTTFEVQELLEPFVAAQLPAVGQMPARADGVFCRFYLTYYERTTAGDGGATSVETNYLVHGGLDFYEAAAGTWFNGYQARQRPFLTWEPTTKKVLPDQPEYLYFMVPADVVPPVSFVLRQRVYFVDGTHQDYTITQRDQAQPFEIFCLPTGPAQLELADKEQVAGQLATHYEVQVLAADGTALSETRTYRLDRRPCRVRRYFLYANSLGGWNTLVCRGDASLDLATKTSASENARPAGYSPLRGDYTINRRTGLPTLHCYAGTRSPEQLVADQDFLLSERVLLLQEGRYLAGQVKDRTVVVLDDDETRRLLQFDYELPRERYHTPHLQ